jgi:hypothetical protein
MLDNIEGVKTEKRPLTSKSYQVPAPAKAATTDDWGEIEPTKPAHGLKPNADALVDDMFGDEDKKAKRPQTANPPVWQAKNDLDDLLDEKPASLFKSDPH